MAVKFVSKLEVTDTTPPLHIVRVSKARVASLDFKGNLRRVVCTLNGIETFNCSLFPTKGDYFITLSKKRREMFGLQLGDTITVELKKDESKYGMPMPEEFAEVLRQDPEGDRLFHALSPGNQRLMLKLVILVKGIDKRIARSLAGIELLRGTDGQFDYHTQHEAMRLVSSPNPVIGSNR